MSEGVFDLLPFLGYDGVQYPARFMSLLMLSTLVDGWLAHRCLFGPGPNGATPALSLFHAARAALSLAVAAPFQVAVLILCGFNVFGIMNLLWYVLILVVPYCGLRALWSARRGVEVTGPARCLAALALAVLPAAYHVRHVAPYDLRLEQVAIPLPKERAGARPLKVAVLADLQTDRVGAYEREAVDRLLAARPDVILVPGDLFHGSTTLFEKTLEPLRALLSRLEAPGGVYFTRGDVDPEERIAPLLQGTGIRRLKNEIVEVEVAGRRLLLGGLDRDFDSDEAREVIRRLDADPSGADVRILMTHRPDVIRLLPENSRIDVTVAGHTHGGQVVIPFFGPPMTLSELPRRVAAGGLHTQGGNRLYVSRGVGHERGQAPRIRFLAPPEISLLLLSGGARE